MPDLCVGIDGVRPDFECDGYLTDGNVRMLDFGIG
jgi:hypothetical protein